jgi:serine/threonine protein kinase
VLSEAELILLVFVGACAPLLVGVVRLLRTHPPRDSVAPPVHAPSTASPRAGARPVVDTAFGRTRAVPARAHQVPPPKAGSLGGYRIVGQLGARAFGTVSLAQSESTASTVAIRLLPRGLAAAPTQRRIRGSIAAASTAHMGLVRVLELGESDDGRLFVVTEHVAGRSLGELLRADAPLEVATALRLALDLGGPVETLHNLGLVHGALHPGNVMVPEGGLVKLMDIELVGLRDAWPGDGGPARKPPAAYRAPEQIRRTAATEKTDVYAFAAIVYEMLCGRPPFREPTREAVLAKHLTATPLPMRRLRRAVPAAIEAVVAQALAKAPASRPSMQEIVGVLKTASDDEQARSRRPARRWVSWIDRAWRASSPDADGPGPASARPAAEATIRAAETGDDQQRPTRGTSIPS